MKSKPASHSKDVPPTLRALRRAARKAIEFARRNGTPAYIMVDGRIVDATKQTRKTRKNRKKK